ncbi:MAG: VWA domain-containing protein [Treponema sp.]|jgi:Ca-activated chloride channel family protein|nr:VWA domain-containing protein [Treponema sp.]
MMFDYPAVLTAFLIFIPIVLFDLFYRHKKTREKLPGQLQKKIMLSDFCFRLFIAFAIIALAGPRWGTDYTVSEYRRGIDIVFAIDVSRSMDLDDGGASRSGASRSGALRSVSQTRLERGITIAAQTASTVTVHAATGARFAAAIGRGRGYLALPLTYDSEAAFSFLETLDGASITGRSTNLEALTDAAANAFQTSSPARKVIVLISDGESHSGVLRNALNRCARDGIIVAAVATGSDEGRPVPSSSFKNELVSELSESALTSEVSRRDASVMRMAAERTGGIYIDANREDASAILSSYLLSLAETSLKPSGTENTQSEPKQRRTLFIVLAMLAYGASKFIPRFSSGGKSRLPLVSLLAVIFFLSSCSDSKLIILEANYLLSRGRYDEAVVMYLRALNYKDVSTNVATYVGAYATAYAEYGLGLTLYSLDEGAAAIKHYENSQKILASQPQQEHRELRYRNQYNSGVVYFEEGDFQSAANAFKEALRTNPEKIEAKHNLELSLISIVNEAAEEKPPETHSETREILFQYIRQQEQQHWRSREWAPEENFTGNDW